MAYRSKLPNVYDLKRVRRAHKKLVRQTARLGKAAQHPLGTIGRAAQDQVLAAARRTPVGRLHGELSSIPRQDLARLVLSSAGLGHLASTIKYARRGDFFGALLGALGPLGTLFGEIIDALSGSRNVSVQDLKAAAQLLTAAGFEVSAGHPKGLSPTPLRPVGPGNRQAPAGPSHPGTAPPGTTPPTQRTAPGQPVTPPIPPHGPPTAPAAPQPALPIGTVPGQQFIQMTKVDNSSNVYAYGYNPDTLTLRVQFLATAVNAHALSHSGGEDVRNPRGHRGRNRVRGRLGATLTNIRRGPGPVYDYRGVPERVFRRFESAGSKGKAVWDELRIRGTISGARYDYSLVAAGVVDVVKPDLTTPAMPMRTVGHLTYVPRKATITGFKPRAIKQGSATYKSVLPRSGVGDLRPIGGK